MELHHNSCLLSSTLAEHDTSMLSNALQVGSANRGVAYIENRTTTLAGNDDSTRLRKHFGGDLDCHFGYHRSEAEVEKELKRVIGILATCEEYQKYRERQPTLKKNDKEQKWPYQREVAFFRALIRWQPMGRRKHMQEGELRGRNMLVAKSIENETGEECTRKHVSSHVQVLKKKLVNCPEVLAYMPPTQKEEAMSRKSRHRSNHSRSRHHSSRHDEAQNHNGSHPYYGHLASSVAGLSRLQRSRDHTLYSVADFGMLLGVGEGHQKRVVHRFTELGRNARLDDVHVRDTTSWHKQFPEFNFHRTEELKNRSVLICDATIKIMTIPSGAELSITFDLGAPPELSECDDLECSTRFFEDGKPVRQDDNSCKIKQAGKVVEKHMEPKGGLRIKFGAGFFGAGFWACQLQKMGNILRKTSEEDQHTRAKYEAIVRRELQQLTAAQDIYRVKDGESKCLLTILWRFGQTRSSNEPGRIKWRAVSFERPQDKMHIKDEDLDKVFGPLMTTHITETTGPTSPIPASSSLMYPSLPLEFNHPFPPNPPALDLDQITLDNLTSDFSHSASTTSSLGHSFSQLQTLSSLSDSRNLSNTQSQVLEDANDFDFTGGQIAITGCLEPTTHLGPYIPYETQLNTQGFSSGSLSSAVADFEQAAHHAMQTNTTFEDLALSISMNTASTAANMTDYVAAPKPSWPHPSLIAQLGDAAEQYSDLMAQATEGGGQMDIGGVLDHGDGSHNRGSFNGGGGGGLWKLGSAFGEDDTGVGAAMGGVEVVGGGGQDCSSSSRKDSLVGKGGGGADGGVLGIMELLQQSTGEEKFRGY
ncbi:hypothetical protein DM02DRAFT_630328 [Periconia macrospinosa]|uniref:TEA domain-containing protein n=1 Tax=Periconia macrospinosa TaxID=97972 RepID=A0A2V1DL82_9PLEO|nr:hypothetical protein DM02DRAFT_630328 [Periconia macrospinosa]